MGGDENIQLQGWLVLTLRRVKIMADDGKWIKGSKRVSEVSCGFRNANLN